MIGNNSCGATAQRTGKVVDNISRLQVLLYDGTRMWVGETSDAEYDQIIAAGGRRAEIYAQLRALRDEYLSQIRTGYPHIPRRVSGYNLDSLLPEKRFHVAQALVGSESTLVTVLQAELKLVPQVTARSLVMLGFSDIEAAADAVPHILRHQPIALEGMDSRLIDFEGKKHLAPDALKLLPDGHGFLLVQFGGDTVEQARETPSTCSRCWTRARMTRRWRSSTTRNTKSSSGRCASPGSVPPPGSLGGRHLARLGGLRRLARRPGQLPA